jgi:PAS domain S-box-containing protein
MPSKPHLREPSRTPDRPIGKSSGPRQRPAQAPGPSPKKNPPPPAARKPSRADAEKGSPDMEARLHEREAELRQTKRILTRQTALLGAVRKAQSLFISRHDPQEVFKELLEALVSATASQFGFLSEVLLDSDGNPFRSSLAISDISWDEDSRRLYRNLMSRDQQFYNNNTLAGAPLLERRIVISNDVACDPRAAGVPRGHPVLHSYMGIPVFFGSDLIGLAGVANRAGGYSTEEAEFIEPLISACASMIWAWRMLRRDEGSMEAMRQSEALLNATQRLTKVGGWEWDVEKQEMFWTEETYRIHDFVPGELALGSAEHIARSLACYRPEDRPLVLKVFQNCAEAGQPYDLELPFTTATGRRLWVRTTAEAVLDKGKIVKVVGNLMDITDRRRVEHSLRESEERFRILFEQAGVGVAIIDTLTGRFVQVNQKYCDIVGYSLEEMQQTTFMAITHPDDLEGDWGQMQQLREGAIRGFTMEKRYFHKTGRLVWVNLTVSPLWRVGEPTLFHVAAVEDITERKSAEAALRKSQEELNRLYQQVRSAREQERKRIAREIHDELGQNLTVLKIDLAWLEKRLPAGSNPLGIKIAAMNHILEATLQTVQRVSAELRPGILDALGLAAAVDWYVRDFEKRAEIQCDLAIEPYEINADPAMATDIFRILQEALTNVTRHSQANWARVHLKQTPEGILLAVSDNGIGISEQQSSNPTSLGLLGMRERVATLGGSLEITGLPGEGTTVRISIPAKEAHA